MLWYLHLTKKDTLLIKSKYSVFFRKLFPEYFQDFRPVPNFDSNKTFTA